jgi:hypothetical protein
MSEDRFRTGMQQLSWRWKSILVEGLVKLRLGHVCSRRLVPLSRNGFHFSAHVF